jgi:hypothetical protein
MKETDAEMESAMPYLNPFKAAVSVGTVLGAWHFMWVSCVAFGIAKPILDFILSLHFLQFDYALSPFAWSTALTLVGLTFTIGAVFGALFAAVWNWLSGREPRRSSERPAYGGR